MPHNRKVCHSIHKNVEEDINYHNNFFPSFYMLKLMFATSDQLILHPLLFQNSDAHRVIACTHCCFNMNLIQDKGAISKNATMNRSPSFGSLGPPRAQNDSLDSSQMAAKRKMFSESAIGRESFRKLLEPSQPLRPGIAPYRIVLGEVKNKVLTSLITNLWIAVCE